MLETILIHGGKVALSKAGSMMLKAHQDRVHNRVRTFFYFLDISYEYISTNDLDKLHKYIESEEGQDLLANYAELITKTSAKRALMSLALIYCNDRDIDFTEVDKLIFIRALDSIDDVSIDIFLKCCDIEVSSLNKYPYLRASVNNQNLKEFETNGWGQAGVGIYINDLIQRRLLLPDPHTGAFASGGEGAWAVWFGISSKSKKFSKAFKKAQALLDTV